MFSANGTPLRAQVSMEGWLLDLAPAQSPAAHLAHELTHVVQQRSGIRAWRVSKGLGSASTPATRSTVRGWDYAVKKPVEDQAAPQTDDEVLLGFEFGDTRHVTVYFNPKEFTMAKPTPWKVELGPVARATVRIVVRRPGAGPLNIAVRSSLDAAGSRATRWTKVLTGMR